MATINPQIILSATQIAEAVLTKVIASPKVNTASVETPAAKQEVKDAVVKASTEVIMNQTNQEPWYRSVVIVTQYVTLIVSLLGLLGVTIDPDSSKLIIGVVLGVGALVAPLVTLWGRLAAKRGLVVVK